MSVLLLADVVCSYLRVLRSRSNKNVTLTLSWNVIPNAGTLPKVRGAGSYRMEFPNDYSSTRL